MQCIVLACTGKVNTPPYI